ncbi:MAG: hypothetical protein L6R38_001043 [Xanthoria sp. 2 TBL-2021]|nr:MAG: hypothetical protein L6R38_001043 [Xanthoria sp. 2 TBL-2021]
MAHEDSAAEKHIASAALAVALSALAIAITQLLGQMFATADGYRRCQPSVMGAWAQYTRLRWKWSEMRFETLFTTPEIFLLAYKTDIEATSRTVIQQEELKWVGTFPGATEYPYSGVPHRSYFGTIDGLEPKLVDHNLGTGSYHETACWLPFLHSIRENESQLHRSQVYQTATQYHTPRRPACRSIQKSWDFMAPELVRPLAVTYVGDIAIIVQRLGMTWQTFRPEEGEMRAEGNGHIIYSTLVRSIGPILHYAQGHMRGVPHDKYGRNANGTVPTEFLLIPTGEADMMRFGILPCYEDLMKCKQYAMGTFHEVRATLDLLDPTGSASKKVRDNRQFETTATFGFPDLISMAAPMLRQEGSTKIRLPVPTEHCCGLTSLKEGFVIFRERLGDYASSEQSEPSHQVSWVLESYDSLKSGYPCWENGFKTDFWVDTDCLFLDQVSHMWWQTTIYFQQLEDSSKVQIRYVDLVACHIKHAVNFWHEAHGRIQRFEGRDHHGLRDWLAEGMHMYWDYLPKIVSEMSVKSDASESLIREAWIMLLFRAFCWSRCHYMCPPEERFPDSTRLRSRYWNSKLPVYLG